MFQFMRAATGLLFLLIGSTFVLADIRLPKIFSDGMVLQRGAAVKIWGTADPDEELNISLGDNSSSVKADANGKWTAEVAPPETGGPYELTIAGTESSVVFTDVFIGDVWICSGESNMQQSLRDSQDFETDELRDAWLSAIDHQGIRLFCVPANSIDEPATDFADAVSWQVCRGQALAEFSATAFFFATALQKYDAMKDVPVGLIDASWSGTPAESWVSRDALIAETSLAPLFEHWNENPDKQLPNRPGNLYNGMIAPLVPLRVRGVIWYQGEANVGRGQQYRTIFSALIGDWRNRLQQQDLPFYFVQLAPYRYGNHDSRDLPEIWDAQRSVLKIPNTGMAGSSDIGDLKEILPKNKQVVGDRLARLAMAGTYGMQGLDSSGPALESTEVLIDKKEIIVHFSHSKGLKCSVDPLIGFTICGEDGEFKQAMARIDGENVIVWSDEVDSPRHVRYLWDDSAATTLFNGADLPAIPFRSDEFDLLSRDKDF